MKKVLKSIFAIMFCFVSLLAFTACGKTSYSKTTNSTEGVISNGGVSVTYNGYVYFINGTKENNEKNNKSSNVQGAIYKAKLDDEGKIVENTTTRVIDKLVGFSDGQIFIFGDFLYYSTPCTDKNKEGEMLNNKTEFRRYDIAKKKDQLIYTTATSSDTITYTYYKNGNNLNLVVFEKNSATLKSIQIGDKMKTIFTKKDVQSVLFSDNAGENKSTTSFADQYIFYTLSYDENSATRHGVRVFKVKPDGTGEEKISEGLSLSLLTIKGGKLIYAESDYVYCKEISNGKDTISLSSDKIICYDNYEKIIFQESDPETVIFVDDNLLRVVSWNSGSYDGKEINLGDSVDEDDIELIGVYENYVIYQNSNKIYKVKFKNATTDETSPVCLSTSSIDDADDSFAPEINGDYVYGMVTDSSTKTTYLYRVEIETPAERGEKDDDGKDVAVGTAEFIGVKE